MGSEMSEVYRSKCCNAEVKLEGAPDFPGSEEICTFSFSCLQCGKPCDVQEKRLNFQDKILQRLFKFFDGLVIHPSKGVILTPEKKRQLVELQEMEQKLPKKRGDRRKS